VAHEKLLGTLPGTKDLQQQERKKEMALAGAAANWQGTVYA